MRFREPTIRHNVHCATNEIDLNLSNNTKSIKLLVKYVNYLITLYKYFSKGLLLKLKKSVE